MLRAGSARLRFARVPRVFFCAGSARVIAFKFITTTTTTRTTTTTTPTSTTTTTTTTTIVVLLLLLLLLLLLVIEVLIVRAGSARVVCAISAQRTTELVVRIDAWWSVSWLEGTCDAIHRTGKEIFDDFKIQYFKACH